MDLLGYGKSLTIGVELGSKRFVVIKGQDKLFAKVSVSRKQFFLPEAVVDFTTICET